jgi:hypothetical protein
LVTGVDQASRDVIGIDIVLGTTQLFDEELHVSPA